MYYSKINSSLLLIILIIFFQSELNSQELIPFEREKLWGYQDSIGNTIIEPQYQYVRNFTEGYAVVVQDDLLGVIDKENDLIIPIEYDYLKYTGNFKFIFGYRTKYFAEYNLGVISLENEIIIPPEYHRINFKNGKFFLTKQFSEIIGYGVEGDVREIIKKHGISDSDGNFILEPKYSNIHFLSNGYIKIRLDLNRKYALFDDKFQQLTPYRYIVIGDFFNGLSKVRDSSNYYGYINTLGKEVIKCEYDSNYIFIDSLAIARKNGKAGIINTNNETILDFKYQRLGIPYKGQVVASDSLKFGIINMKGETLLGFEYEKKISEFKGITALQKDNVWQIWDYENQRLFKSKYDEIKLIEGDENKVFGFGRIKKKKHSQSVAYVRLGDKWGVINDKGEILTPIENKLSDLYFLKY